MDQSIPPFGDGENVTLMSTKVPHASMLQTSVQGCDALVAQARRQCFTILREPPGALFRKNQNEHTPFEVGGPELDLGRYGWTDLFSWQTTHRRTDA
jgi:hypothetical protein